jgi:hypothetical protein
MISGKRVRGEIANEQRRKNVETENGQDGSAAAMGDHAWQDGLSPLRRL